MQETRLPARRAGTEDSGSLWDPAAGCVPAARRFLGAGLENTANAGGSRLELTAPHAASPAAPPCRAVPCRTLPYRTVPYRTVPCRCQPQPGPAGSAARREPPSLRAQPVWAHPSHQRSLADNSKMEDEPSQPLINNVARCLPV